MYSVLIRYNDVGDIFHGELVIMSKATSTIHVKYPPRCKDLRIYCHSDYRLLV